MHISGLKQDFDKKLSSLSGKYTKYQVFADFLEIAAITFGNSPVSQGVLPQDDRYKELEERYLKYVPKYGKAGMSTLAQMLVIVQLALAQRKGDFLGTFFQEAGLKGASLKSVELTPYALAKVMAQMTLGDRASLRQKIEQKGYVSLDEPACGAGIMPIVVTEVMEDMGFDPSRHLFVRATDKNRLMFCMTYIQLSIYAIPAVVQHGNTLSQEMWESWETPQLQVMRRHQEIDPAIGLLALMAELEGERSVGEAVSGAGEASGTDESPPAVDDGEARRKKPLLSEDANETSQQLELFDWTGKLESD